MNWRAEYEEMGGYDCMTDAWVIKDDDGNTVAVVDMAHYEVPPGSGSDHDRLKAELEEKARRVAHLIAAAPKMKAALEYIGRWNGTTWSPEQARDLMNEALKEAE
jgi:hypothetical protein